jgi:hypothetical protein
LHKGSSIAIVSIIGLSIMGSGVIASYQDSNYNWFEKFSNFLDLNQFVGYLSGVPPPPPPPVSPIDDAKVLFNIVPRVVTPDHGQKYFQNVVDQCIFSSMDVIPKPLCVRCKILDMAGKIIGKGEVFDPAKSYTPPEKIIIPITSEPPVPEGTPAFNVVNELSAVQLSVCAPGGQGCSLGFWKNHATSPPWQTYNTGDIYATVFGLASPQKDLKIKVNNVDIKLKDVTLLQALNAQGGGLNNLARQSVAALLNSVALSGAYPYTTAQVLSLTKAAIIAGGSAIDNQATAFDTANNLEGPLCNGTSGSCQQAPTVTTTVDSYGNVKVVYMQSRNLNDNSYGVNAVGWGTKGHTFKDLHNSDQLQFKFVRNSDGATVLNFFSDYITTTPGNNILTPGGVTILTPSHYASLGPFGGDGSMVTGTNAWVKEYRSSFADNLNNNGYFTNGVQSAPTKLQADLLLDSPKTISSSSYTLVGGSLFTAWDFTDTYTVIISKDAFPGGFSGKYTVSFPSLHNSPEKKCP